MLSWIELEDIPELVALSMEAHFESKYSNYDFKEDFFYEVYTAAANNEYGRFCVKYVKQDIIVGIFVAHITEMSFCNFKMAIDDGVFVKKEFRGSSIAIKMFKEFFKWCEAMKVKPSVFIHYAEDNDKMYGFCQKVGLIEQGRFFVGE